MNIYHSNELYFQRFIKTNTLVLSKQILYLYNLVIV